MLDKIKKHFNIGPQSVKHTHDEEKYNTAPLFIHAGVPYSIAYV